MEKPESHDAVVDSNDLLYYWTVDRRLLIQLLHCAEYENSVFAEFTIDLTNVIEELLKPANQEPNQLGSGGGNSALNSSINSIILQLNNTVKSVNG